MDVPAEHEPISDSAHALNNGDLAQSVVGLLRAVTILSLEVAELKKVARACHQSPPERGISD